MKQMLAPSSGGEAEAPGRSLKPGYQQHPGPEKQDSHHKLINPVACP